ncbi:hypothetical protein [Mycobacteroides abscessus]|uniref:hypothetical protein n=1 Tax=Mycobacteroides abscessus TaxID=36809 RepID=UPI00092A4D66|nr:hypothetical protein [Mycobacteroides abscessus]SIC21071.1 putative regulator component [Mycobacteroides abscessus subsp. abscessus]
MPLTNDEMLAKARELPLPKSWDRAQFIRNLAEMRGRPIHLVAIDTVRLAGSPCGLWIKRANDDIIVHEAGTSEYHIDQIVRHEVGHMMLGHDRAQEENPDAGPAADLFHTVMPSIKPAAVRAVLGRQDFSGEQEREAETFATMLMFAAHEKETKASMMRSVFFRR